MAKREVKTREPSARPPGAAPKPWELQPEEPLDAFRYFCFYRDMERRSIHAVARVFKHRSPRKMERYSSKWTWKVRVRAWDAEMDRRLRDAQVADIADMKKRHINIGLGMQTAVVKELQAWVYKIEVLSKEAVLAGQTHHEPVLGITDLIRLSTHGTQLERLNRGEPTDHTRVDLPDEERLAALSVKELKSLKAMKKKLGGDDA